MVIDIIKVSYIQMKKTPQLLAALIALPAYGTTMDEAKQIIAADITLQEADTVMSRSLNDIRFENWDSGKWLDNEYIRTLRKYLDDYNNGIVSNPDLDPYREQIKGRFVIYDISAYILGGAFIKITFLDMPDRVFSCWVYSCVDEEKETVISYDFRFIAIEEERTGMTKEDILQAIKEVDGLRLW